MERERDFSSSSFRWNLKKETEKNLYFKKKIVIAFLFPPPWRRRLGQVPRSRSCQDHPRGVLKLIAISKERKKWRERETFLLPLFVGI